MIISHKNKYIFMHTPKTGGSSMTVYLSRFMGQMDIQIGVWHDRSKAGISPNARFLLDMATPHELASVVKHTLSGDLNWKKLNSIHKRKYHRRIGPRVASHVRDKFRNEWNKYFKFAFVRNPFSRLVSQYHWQRLDKGICSFSEFLELLEREDFSRFPPMHNPWQVVAIDDQVVMDKIGRFENLAEDFRDICDLVGIPYEANLFPEMKRGQTRNYRDCYNATDRARVERMCYKELKTFDYQF